MPQFTLEDLNSKNKITQNAAIEYYSNEISEEDLAKLNSFFQSNPKSETGLTYAIILGRRGNKEVIDKLILYLQNKNYSLQKQAEIALIRVGRNAIEALIKTTAVDDKPLLMRIAQIIRCMDDVNIPLLLKMLESGTMPMKIISALVLGRVRNDDKVLVALIKSLANDEPELDRIVCAALVENGEKVIPLIQKVFKNCNERIAGILMEALHRIGTPSTKLLMECLDSPTLELRRHAPYALRFAKTPEIMNKMVETLNDSDFYVCESACKYLVENLKDAGYLIIKKLSENTILLFQKQTENVISENQMYWLIKTLASNFAEHGEHILLYMKYPDEVKQGQMAIPDNLKISLANAISENMNPVFISRLIKMLGDESFFVRENAVKLMSENGQEFVAQMIMALGDPSESVREGLIRVLKLIKEKAFGILIENLKMGNNEMRYNSAYALGFMEDSSAVGPLKAALNDGNDWVREYTMLSLGRLGEVDALINLLPRATDQARVQISRSLGLCGVKALMPLVETLKKSPIDKREPIARAMMEIGEKVKEPLQSMLETEENENVRFWLLKVIRSFNKKPDFK